MTKTSRNRGRRMKRMQGRLQPVSAREVLERAYGKMWVKEAELDLDAGPLTPGESHVKIIRHESRQGVVHPPPSLNASRTKPTRLIGDKKHNLIVKTHGYNLRTRRT